MKSLNSMKELVDKLVEENVIKTKKVYESMLKVDRADFVICNPYSERAQSIKFNVVISAPCLHAYPLEYLFPKIKMGSKILDVGFGSGYLTVAFSKLMDDTGLVIGIEHIKGLYDFGKANIMKHHKNLLEKQKIILVEGDGRNGYEKYAPYKIIHVGAGSKVPPQKLIDQLDFGGRMYIPLGPDDDQYVHIIDKDETGKITQIKTDLSVCYVLLTSQEKQMRGEC